LVGNNIICSFGKIQSFALKTYNSDGRDNK